MRPLWQEHHAVSRRQAQTATPPRPQACDGPKERALARAAIPHDEQARASGNIDLGRIEPAAAPGRGQLEPLEGQATLGMVLDGNAIEPLPHDAERCERITKRLTRRNVACQSAMRP